MKQLFLFLLGIAFFSESLTQALPDQWLGQWQGELSIYNLKQEVPQQVKMRMDIQPINDTTWLWQTTYYAEDSILSEKKYELVTIDAIDGLYRMDELNGIELQAQVLGDRLITFYEVADYLMTVVYYIRNTELHFEVLFTNKDSKKETGALGENIPLVINYRASTFQQAVLKKLK